MKRAKKGDLYKLIYKGKYYAVQFLETNATFGEVVSVFRLSEKNVDEFGNAQEIFSLLFPVNAAVREGYLKYVGNYDVLKKYQSQIKLRYPNSEHPSGSVVSWTIVEQGSRYRLKDLQARDYDYPIAIAVNIEKLEELIDIGWDGRESPP